MARLILSYWDGERVTRRAWKGTIVGALIQARQYARERYTKVDVISQKKGCCRCEETVAWVRPALPQEEGSLVEWLRR